MLNCRPASPKSAPNWAPTLLLSLFLGLGCRVPEAARPCLSDNECHADRICHEGRCRFVEDVKRELAGIDSPPPTACEDAAAPAPRAAPPAQASALGGTTMFMGDERHTGRLPFEGPRAQVKPVWTYHTGSRIYASAVIAESGDVIVGSLDQSLTAVTPDGALRFRYSGAGKFYASAVVTREGDIVAGSLDGTLVALSALGQVRWQHKLKDAIDTSPVLGPDGRIFVAADGMYAFDSRGKLLFHYPVGAHVRSAPAVHPKGFIVFGTPQGKLIALGADGTLLWQAEAGANMDGGAAIN